LRDFDRLPTLLQQIGAELPDTPEEPLN
jgi:hypothetical protein